MFKQILKWLFLIVLIIFAYYKLVIRGNNRLTVYHHHGVWLPSSTSNINFILYPDFPNITDNTAWNECETDKDDYIDLLREQKYKYVLRKDTSADKLLVTTYESEYSKIPDSLLNKFPASFKFKSRTGDFLMINAEIKDSNTVKVILSTDWN